MSNLITEEYKKTIQQVHDNETWGTSSWRWVENVIKLTKKYNTNDILDYGCGAGLLQKGLSFKIFQYDPGREEFSEKPTAHDIVVCTDVLEHIEPECLDAVLNNIQELTRKVVFLTVATRKACKILPDGRNAHLIVEDRAWWLAKLEERFDIINQFGTNREFTIIGTPK